MESKYGKVVKCLGGLYEMRVIEQDGSIQRISCRAKGVLRRDEEKVLVGDEVKIQVSENE